VAGQPRHQPQDLPGGPGRARTRRREPPGSRVTMGSPRRALHEPACAMSGPGPPPRGARENPVDDYVGTHGAASGAPTPPGSTRPRPQPAGTARRPSAMPATTPARPRPQTVTTTTRAAPGTLASANPAPPPLRLGTLPVAMVTRDATRPHHGTRAPGRHRPSPHATTRAGSRSQQCEEPARTPGQTPTNLRMSALNHLSPGTTSDRDRQAFDAADREALQPHQFVVGQREVRESGE
jgi:hypothetical protein